MKKEDFVRKIRLIQNFHSEQETVGALISKISDGFPVVTMGSYLVIEILEQINKDMGIKDKDFLDWWMYDGSEKVVTVDEKKIKLETVEELYNFLDDFYMKDKKSTQ